MLLEKIKGIFKIYGYYHTVTFVIHLLAVGALIYLDSIYFLYGMIFFFLFMPLLQLILHEYVSHEIIQPRNPVINLLVLLFFYTHGQTVKNKRAFHVTHHVHYLDADRDPTQLKIRAAGNLFRYIFNLQKPLAQELVPVKNSLLDNDRLVSLLEPHALKIVWGYRLIMFVLLPVEWFAVFVLYFVWLNIVIYGMHDVFFHGTIKGKDSSLLLPVWGNGSWHIKHHEDPDSLYFGPGWIKWLNLGWYYYLLLFRPGKNSVALSQ